MTPFEIAIERVKKLFQERSAPSFWADNIIESSRDLTTKYDWSRFYSYITNPTAYNPDAEIVTLDDLVIEPPEMKEDPRFETTRYQNGPGETILHIKLKPTLTIQEEEEEEDEKVE